MSLDLSDLHFRARSAFVGGILSLAATLAAAGCGATSEPSQPFLQPPERPGTVIHPAAPTEVGGEIPGTVARAPEGSSYRDVEIRVVENGASTRAHLWTANQEGPYAHGDSRGAGILIVTGVDGGFYEPVGGIFSRMAEKYSKLGLPVAFVSYREPGELEPSVQDALAGAAWLRSQGVSRIAVMGWSFGGAVITNSAPRIPESVTVVGLAPQALFSAEGVELFKKQSLLLFHSRDDDNVPYESSSDILEHAPAQIKKELVSFDGEDHYMEGVADRIDSKVISWLDRELGIQ